MKAFLSIFAVAIVLGLFAYGGYSVWQSSAGHAGAEVGQFDELAWLREEFSLDEAQFARVERLHAQYLPICELLCDQVIDAKVRFESALMASETYTHEVEEELSRLTRVMQDCHRSMLQHVYEVAAVMDPEQRQRYLDMAKSQVTRHASIHP